MKQITIVDQLHRRRLTALEAALKQARAEQATREAALEACCLSEAATRQSGLQLKHEIDRVLFAGTVNPTDLNKARHQLQAAQDALLAAVEAVKSARSDVAAAEQRTAQAVQAWRAQAITVEKFGVLLNDWRTAHEAEALYREEMEQEDVFRRRA